MTSAARWREHALAAAHAGDMAAAAAAFAKGAADHPGDAAFLNSAGNHHARQGDLFVARDYFDRALVALPSFGEALVNRAITLSRMGRREEALAGLTDAVAEQGGNAAYWSTRAGLERETGRVAAAARSYDRALSIDPARVVARHARARVALERGEPDAVARYQAAVAAAPGDAQAWLGLAQALDHAGDRGDARSVLEQIVGQVPGWTTALEELARLRWADGEADKFCDHYRAAVPHASDVTQLYLSWIAMLAGADRFAEATAVAAEGVRRVPGDMRLALLEAVHSGEAGDDDRADAILSRLPLGDQAVCLHSARHWLRRRDPARAERLAADVLATSPENVAAWALRDLAWRLLDDPRHAWLHDVQELIRQVPVELPDDVWEHIITLLREIHATCAVPIGQSVRGGTQTCGRLFDRFEPAFDALGKAVSVAVERYRRALPPADPSHPLLKHRDSAIVVGGVWSVRLTGAGMHVPHIHPEGLLSSALHLRLPDDIGDRAGWLELGRSPPDLRLDLPPLHIVEPRVGQCVLFPSTLYHGTRGFAGGERMSIAFDVTAAER